MQLRTKLVALAISALVVGGVILYRRPYLLEAVLPVVGFLCFISLCYDLFRSMNRKEITDNASEEK